MLVVGVDSGLGKILCCVFSVKQLVMSTKGRISEEIRSKDHLPTYRSLAGFKQERDRERDRKLRQCPGLKRSDVPGLWQQELIPSLNGNAPPS